MRSAASSAGSGCQSGRMEYGEKRRRSGEVACENLQRDASSSQRTLERFHRGPVVVARPARHRGRLAALAGAEPRDEWRVFFDESACSFRRRDRGYGPDTARPRAAHTGEHRGVRRGFRHRQRRKEGSATSNAALCASLGSSPVSDSTTGP